MANQYDQPLSDAAPAAASGSTFDNALAAEGTTGRVADIARSIYQQESGSGRNTKTSNAGAVGGMQIIPATFNQVADQGWNISDPEHNARAGIRYVQAMYDKAGGDPTLTAVGYYGGPGAIDKARQGVAVADPRNPQAPDTLQYAQQVTGRLPAQKAGGGTMPWKMDWSQGSAPQSTAGQAATSQAKVPMPWEMDWSKDASGQPSAATDGGQPPAVAAPAGQDVVSNPFNAGAASSAQSGAAANANAAPAANAPSGLSMTTDINGNPLPQRTVSFLHGLADPLAGASQLISNVVPDSVKQGMNDFGKWIADKTGQSDRLWLTGKPFSGDIGNEIKQGEQDYEQARAANGETGFDGYRVLGNVLNPVNLIPGVAEAKMATIPRIAAGAGIGAASSALAPVGSDDFAGDKIKQVGFGALAGAAAPVVGGAISRLISPNASTNANVQLLRDEGVVPTIGQTLGGWANATEQKLQSVPILGDMIRNARINARQDFNNAAINRATGPIGVEVNGTGHQAVDAAHQALGDAYDKLLPQMTFRADQQLVSDLSKIPTNHNMRPEDVAEFNRLLQSHVSGFNGGATMSGQDFKTLESALGNEVSTFSKSPDAYQKKIGGALGDALDAFRGALSRSNPNQAADLQRINQGYANLVRVEDAAKRGVNAEGVFTPGQLNQAVRAADDSARGNAVARGKGLMQDLSNAGQQVLGDTIPNSGTVDRALLAGGALGSYVLNPAIPASLLAAGSLYMRPVQRMLGAAVADRPAIAQPAADAVARLAGGLSPLASQISADRLNQNAQGRQQRYADGGMLGDDGSEAAAAAEDQAKKSFADNQDTIRSNEADGLRSMGEDTFSLGYGGVPTDGFANGGMIGDHRKFSAIRALAFGRATAVNPRPAAKAKGKVPRIAA